MVSGVRVQEYWVSNILGLAVYKGNYEIIEYLLDNLEKPDLEYGAKLIKQDGKDKKITNLYIGLTPLMLVFQTDEEVNKLEITKLLLQHGASLQSKSQGGNQFIFWSAFYGHIPITEYLLQNHKIDFEHRNGIRVCNPNKTP